MKRKEQRGSKRRNMKKYIVVTNESLDLLADDVNKMIERGYYPQGGILQSYDESWSQAMVYIEVKFDKAFS